MIPEHRSRGCCPEAIRTNLSLADAPRAAGQGQDDGRAAVRTDIVVGVVGAFVAGLVLNLLGVDVNSGGYWFTFLIALGGAIVLLLLARLVRRT